MYAAACADELFSGAEADAFRAWLEKHEPFMPCKVTKIDLPLENNLYPLRAVPVGGGPNILLIHEANDYDLPFQVSGFFDTRFASEEPEQKTVEFPVL